MWAFTERHEPGGERGQRLLACAAKRDPAQPQPAVSRHVSIPVGGARLQGDLEMPRGARGIVLFAHGAGSSRMSPRNRFVARVLKGAGIATLLMDLLTEAEEEAERYTRHLRFDIDLLAARLIEATDWVRSEPAWNDLPVGYFGASTGAAAALVAAAERPDEVGAVVSRGGRPDLAGRAVSRVLAPTLLIVGGRDPIVQELNAEAFDQLRVEKRLEIVPGAGHLFEEPGTLERVAELARDWFDDHLGATGPGRSPSGGPPSRELM